jgi:hypothetical protein
MHGAAPKTSQTPGLLPGRRQGFSAEPRQNLFPGVTSERRSPLHAETATAARVMPAFPYRYSGWVLSGSELRVYLQRGDEIISVVAGETLDGAWRVNALTTEWIEVSFVPDGQRFSIALAGPAGETSVPRGSAMSAAAAPGQPDPAAGMSQAAARPQIVAVAEPVLAGTVGAPALGARAQFGPFMAGGARGASPAAAQNPGASAGPGGSSEIPTGKLGIEAPAFGSMPSGGALRSGSMPGGPAPAGLLPSSPAPAARLGLDDDR